MPTVTVRALLNHLSGPSFTEDLDPQWWTVLPQRLADLVETWKQPGARQGESSLAGTVLPNDQVAMVAPDELVLHGWDVAAAIGQPFDLHEGADPGLCGFISALASDSGMPGLFGSQPVPAGAPQFDHMLAMSGRDPDWQPGTV
ncbi:uncharacterized protein (TIGR03086 family) [Mycobacteroides chelonae]|nr:uncharacterized protein (TIGR03086 family) [Mycobacteroides chelonae]